MSGRVRQASDAPPVAIVGIAGLYPPQDDLEGFWARLLEGNRAFHVTESNGRLFGSNRLGSHLSASLDVPQVGVEKFGIPPVHGRSISTIFSLTLSVVEQCFHDAGYSEKDFPRDRTNIVYGSCFAPGRTVANSLRIESARVLDELSHALAAVSPRISPQQIDHALSDLRKRYDRGLGGGIHDKLYEIASTLPAQIAVRFRLRGPAVALEAGELTSFAALKVAVDALREGACDLVVVSCGQLFESALPEAAIAGKRLLAEHSPMPLARTSTGFLLGEGVGAVLLKRLSDARRDGDRVRAVIRGIGLSHESERSAFRYGSSVSARMEAIGRAYEEAGYGPEENQFIECFGSGFADETMQEIEALGRSLGSASHPIRLGSVKSLIGHTFANAGLASLTKVVLSLENRTLVPEHHLPEAEAIELEETPFRIEQRLVEWPAPETEGPRRAAISGSALGGAHAHIAVEEFLPDSTEVARDRVTFVPGPEPARAHAPIAIVGLEGTFGQSRNAGQLWEHMHAGIDQLRPVPDSILPRPLYSSSGNFHPLKSYTDIGAPVEIGAVEPHRYRLLPARLREMDPAQKLALQIAAGALQSYAPHGALHRGRAAVVTASSLTLLGEKRANVLLERARLRQAIEESPLLRTLSPGHRSEILERLEQKYAHERMPGTGYTLDGLLASGISTFISNALELDAVPIAVQAACASSLAALDIACRGLRSGSYDLALAGGVELGVNPFDFVLCSRMRLLSQDRITPFDVRADGFSIGEGAGFFVLRRLEDALADGSPIRAIIRSVGGSSDAHSMIAPDAAGQALAMRRAFEPVDFSPDSVDYIETHGTGTKLGDRVEVTSIREVYGSGTRDRPLVLGSIKSMIGHSMAAAGAAGLLKTILALQSHTFPPNANLRELNPALQLEQIPATVPTKPIPWPRKPDAPRRAGISSFGTGGVNYHLLIEEASQGD